MVSRMQYFFIIIFLTLSRIVSIIHIEVFMHINFPADRLVLFFYIILLSGNVGLGWVMCGVGWYFAQCYY